MLSRKKASENIAPAGFDAGLKGHALDGPKGLQGKVKRIVAGTQPKRTALVDIANSEKEVKVTNEKKKIPVAVVKSKVKTANLLVPAKVFPKPAVPVAKKKPVVKKVEQEQPQPPAQQKRTRSTSRPSQDVSIISVDNDSVLQDRVEEDISVLEEDDLLAVDRENIADVFNVGNYAQDIFTYYKNREKLFEIPAYLASQESQNITGAMRAILVDWMVEIQENFELNHETLYLGVKITDLYLSRTAITKDSLQLVGAVALFIASKFDEQRYPLIEDFTYVCDNAFDAQQFLEMEMQVLKRIDFDLGIPISYRFLRRYSKVGRKSIETLTLARFILEMSLMEADFISAKDSKLAAASLFLAMKMRRDGKWEGDLVKASGYIVMDFKSLVVGLNKMLTAPPNPQVTTIRCKYSHPVFHEVANIPTLKTDLLFL